MVNGGLSVLYHIQHLIDVGNGVETPEIIIGIGFQGIERMLVDAAEDSAVVPVVSAGRDDIVSSGAHAVPVVAVYVLADRTISGADE